MNLTFAQLLVGLPFLLASLASCQLVADPDSSREHRYAALLIQKLTGPNSKYNRTIMPAILTSNSSPNATVQPFVVQVRLFLVRIHEIIENQEALITAVRLQLGWTDPALRWDPEEHGGVTAVIIPASAVWIPDLHVANTIAENGLIDAKDYDIRVTYKGQVWFHPQMRVSTRCGLDLTFYPYDFQRCPIVVESAVLTSKELSIKLRQDKSDPISLGMYSENPMWTLIDADGFAAMYKSGQNTAFGRIHFWLIVKRKPDHFERTFLVPLILLSVLQLLTYLMPMHCIDRVPQSTVVMMTAFFLQGYVSDSLPRSSEGESYIQTYINLIIGLSVATVFICAITSELVQPDEGLRMWGMGSLFRFCCKEAPTTNEPKHRNNRGAVFSGGIDDPMISMYDNMPASTIVRLRRRKKLRKTTAIAAVLNWAGFAFCAAVSTLYPLIAFMVIIPRNPPPMPQPPLNGITNSYFAEY